jgi:hypothetical protein
MWTGIGNATCVASAEPMVHFADPTLAQPLMQDQADSCSLAAPSIGAYFAGCEATYFQRGARFEGNTVYNLKGEAQAVSSMSDGLPSFHRAGARIEFNQFAQASLKHETTSTRLTPVDWVTSDGGKWFSNWYDKSLETDCAFSPDMTGVQRCLPSGEGSTVVYADELCTEAVTEIEERSACGGERQAPKFVSEYSHNSCGGTLVGVRRVQGARSLRSVYEKSEAGACNRRSASAGYQYFGLSAPLPMDYFVSGSPETTNDPNAANLR